MFCVVQKPRSAYANYIVVWTNNIVIEYRHQASWGIETIFPLRDDICHNQSRSLHSRALQCGTRQDVFARVFHFQSNYSGGEDIRTLLIGDSNSQ
jgi:hypothetical protein